MNEDKETTKIEERLESIEKNLEKVIQNQDASKRPLLAKVGIGCLSMLAGLFLFLVLIGIIKFISNQ